MYFWSGIVFHFFFLIFGLMRKEKRKDMFIKAFDS